MRRLMCITGGTVAGLGFGELIGAAHWGNPSGGGATWGGGVVGFGVGVILAAFTRDGGLAVVRSGVLFG